MAHIDITLEQDEILRLLGDSSGDAFKILLQESLNGVLKAESAEQLHATPYERCAERTDSRNGTRLRHLTTRIGDIELTVPRHRNVPFKTLVFENHKRSEAALVITMAEMVVAGVSTAKVGRVMEEICGKSFSKQTVSEACAEPGCAVAAFCERRIEEDCLFVMADATYLKAREDHRIKARALPIAIGLTRSGHKEAIGFGLADAESEKTRTAFLGTLRSRGLHGMQMLASDSHEGLMAALGTVFPDVPWQRCQGHFARNVAEGAPKRLRKGLRSELTEMSNCPAVEKARARRDEIIADCAKEAPGAVECLDRGFDDAMTVMELPSDMRRRTRTSNYLERLNKEVKRRSKVVGVFPSAESATRLMGAFLIEENERWALMNKIYYSPACEELERRMPALIKIAHEQHKLKKAA